MWNYSFVLPEFIILYVFAVYYFAQPRLPISINCSFLRVILADCFVILSDVAASLALENADYFGPFVLRALNVLYFVLFFFRIFSFFIFTEDVIGIRRSKKNFVSIFSTFAFVVFEGFAVLNLYFNTLFSISKEGVYSRSLFYNVIYICAAFFLFLSFFCIFFYRKRLNRFSNIALLAINAVMLVGYVSRFLFPKYLIMNLFTLIAIIIILLAFENPVNYLAGKVNAFNKKGLAAIFNEIDEKKPPFILAFVINNYNELREIYSGTQMDRGIALITQHIAKNYPECLRFYLHDGRFVLVGKDYLMVHKIKAELTERFNQSWCAGKDVDIFIEPKFVLLEPELSFENPSKVLNALFTAIKEVEKLESGNITINSGTLDTIDQNTLVKRCVERAVENNGVEMFLQPLIDTRNGRLTGAEALARIRDEEGNLIPPVKFIPVAEKNGRINRLGEQMFEKACKFISEHDVKKMGLNFINVNLSPVQFLRPDLSRRFFKILKKYGVAPEMIHLEITEESMIDYAVLKKQIQTMRDIGFEFVLDDYGSGYSNVSRIKRCPFINIKLDMELVRDYAKERDKLLPTLVQAFKHMEFTVTAEGVETNEMADDMTKIGCDYLQGYYFSKPLPAEEFAKTYEK